MAEGSNDIVSDVRIAGPTKHHEDIVDWEGPNDPENPMNWALGKRKLHAFIVSMIALIVNLASTMFAPAAPLLAKELGITTAMVGSLTVSIYVLGFAIGPLLLSPLSELYGRLIVYQCTNFVYLAFTLGCALSTNTEMFLLFRFIAGCAGSAPMTIAGGTIADLFPQEERGAMMGLTALGPIIGPIAGPVAGGFIGQEIGWRWTFWIILIASGAINITAFIVMRETYAPILLARKTSRLQKSTNNPNLRSKLDKGIPSNRLVLQSIQRPLKLLIFSPIVLLLSLYVAFTFGLTFILFTTFPIIFKQQYGFSAGTSGLAYLGLGVGFMLGMITFAALSDKILQAKAAKVGASRGSDIVGNDMELAQTGEPGEAEAGPKYKPELRLFLMVCLTPVLPFGFFWYGWAAEEGTHWIVPILGTGLIGIGSLFVMMPAQTYLVDIYGSEAAASALAANTLIRSLFGAFLPLAGPDLYDSLGLGWGNSLLGFIALAFVPVPYLFYRYGERIRMRFPVRL
ncbi:MFS general substrate transporter [Lentithecium fluviatile CBS 122367]|uniref:MFS general substrate transporter n=1 Tax=Lentithecium fluviatile CBS 122367 TaxID=1168545 RepID=A0A6G1JKI9_9PLEO|nr:MFS general substrate transporter [Lentithecium fluviatile CBS 122367]